MEGDSIKPANAITFKVTAAPQSGAWTITKAWIGNLVDPDTGASKWYTDPDTGFPYWCTPPAMPSWTWKYATPAACVPFGLSFEFEVEANGQVSTQTAIGHIRVDPTQLSGHPFIEVGLEPCRVSDPAFPALNVVVVSGPATVQPTVGQPVCCPPPTVDVLMMVDVQSALASGNLGNSIYMVDTNRDMGTYQEGGHELTTVLEIGSHIVWSVTPINPGTTIAINGFTGPAVDAGIIHPVEDPTHHSYKAQFQPPGGAASGTRYQYSVELDFQGKTMTCDAFLQIE